MPTNITGIEKRFKIACNVQRYIFFKPRKTAGSRMNTTHYLDTCVTHMDQKLCWPGVCSADSGSGLHGAGHRLQIGSLWFATIDLPMLLRKAPPPLCLTASFADPSA